MRSLCCSAKTQPSSPAPCPSSGSSVASARAIADWIATQPPSEWRKPVNKWVRGLRSDPFRGAEHESALDAPGWSGWFAEIPDAGNTWVAVVAYFGVSEVEPVIRCFAIGPFLGTEAEDIASAPSTGADRPSATRRERPHGRRQPVSSSSAGGGSVTSKSAWSKMRPRRLAASRSDSGRKTRVDVQGRGCVAVAETAGDGTDVDTLRQQPGGDVVAEVVHAHTRSRRRARRRPAAPRSCPAAA